MREYFALAEGFGPAESDLRTSLTGKGDRLWSVWAAKRRLRDGPRGCGRRNVLVS